MRRIDILRSYLKAHDLSGGYSAIMRQLNKEQPEKIPQFMKTFKDAFDRAMEEELEDADKIALLEAVKSNG